MPDILAIDTHVHTYPASNIGIQAMGGAPRVAGSTGVIEELLPLMERAHITHSVMVNMTPVADMVDAARSRLPANLTQSQKAEAEEGIRQEMARRVTRRNQWTRQVAEEHPHLLAFIGVDPVMTSEAMAAEVEERHSEGARGIKLHTVVQRVAVNDHRLWPAYRAAEALGVVVLAHTGPFGGVDFPGARPGLAAEVLTDFPRLKLILAHCGGRPYYQEAVALARQFPQVYFDCCGVVTGTPEPDDLTDEELVSLFRALGAERITFGSDWPFRDPVPDLDRLSNLPMSEAERQLVLVENARRLLDL